ncbi:MAG: hypothetical protein H8E44_25125 [Planctomycetes bacterium]|nr:hypothetical protein [Planctomycetota bacterium]
MNIQEFFNEWGGVVGAIVGVLGAALGGYCGAKNTNGWKEIPFMLKVAVWTWVGLVVFLGLLFGLGFALRTGPGTEFQRSGNPALKLEVRRASTEKVEGWEPTTLKEHQEDHTFYVSPEVELSNDDVASTGVYFNPILGTYSGRQKRQDIWFWGTVCLVLSVFIFVQGWRSKRWSSGVPGVFFLLLSLGFFVWGFATPVDDHGFWQVVIKFNDAGTKKMALLSADLAPQKGQWKGSPSKHMAFFIDGELTFSWGFYPGRPLTDGVLFLGLSSGSSKEDATRIAKGIVSQ